MPKPTSLRVAVVLAVAGSLVLAAWVAASTAGSPPTVYACAQKKGGAARLFKKATRCKKGETRLSWNVAAPAGVRGETGPRGERGEPGAEGKAVRVGTYAPGEIESKQELEASATEPVQVMVIVVGKAEEEVIASIEVEGKIVAESVTPKINVAKTPIRNTLTFIVPAKAKWKATFSGTAEPRLRYTYLPV